MTKRAALQLARYFLCSWPQGQNSAAQVAEMEPFTSVEFQAPKERVVRRRKLVLRCCGADPRYA